MGKLCSIVYKKENKYTKRFCSLLLGIFFFFFFFFIFFFFKKKKKQYVSSSTKLKRILHFIRSTCPPTAATISPFVSPPPLLHHRASISLLAYIRSSRIQTTIEDYYLATVEDYHPVENCDLTIIEAYHLITVKDYNLIIIKLYLYYLIILYIGVCYILNTTKRNKNKMQHFEIYHMHVHHKPNHLNLCIYFLYSTLYFLSLVTSLIVIYHLLFFFFFFFKGNCIEGNYPLTILEI
jgi:hypothetical protein